MTITRRMPWPALGPPGRGSCADRFLSVIDAGNQLVGVTIP